MSPQIYSIEIPVRDMDRAVNFYSSVFQTNINVTELTPEFKMAFFQEESPGATVSLVWNKTFYKPSPDEGVLVHLNGDPDLSEIEKRIEPAGGKVLIAKRQISPEAGYMALFEDTEGNRLGLRSVV